MDTLNHTAQGFLIAAMPVTLITGSTSAGFIVGGFYGIVGALPDLIGEYYAHFKEKDGYKYQAYGIIHTCKKMKVWAKIVLFTWYLHILEDSFLHGEKKRWWCINERGRYEIFSWIINLIGIFFYLKLIL